MKSHPSQAAPRKMELEIHGHRIKFPGRLPFPSKWKSHEVLAYTDSDDEPGAEPYYVYLDERKGWQITLERIFPEPESDEDEPDAPYVALTLQLPPGMEKAPDFARSFFWDVAHAVGGDDAAFFCQGEQVPEGDIWLT